MFDPKYSFHKICLIFTSFLVGCCTSTRDPLFNCKDQITNLILNEKIDFSAKSASLFCENKRLEVVNGENLRNKRASSEREYRLRETRRSYYSRKRKVNSSVSSKSSSSSKSYPRYVVRQRTTSSASCRQFCETSISQLQRQLSQSIGHRQNVKVELERCMNQKRTSVRKFIVLSENYKRANKSMAYCKAEVARKNIKIKDQYDIVIELQEDLRRVESEIQTKTEQCNYDLESSAHKCKYEIDASRHRCQDQIQQHRHNQQMCQWDLEQMTQRADELEGILKSYAEMLRKGEVQTRD